MIEILPRADGGQALGFEIYLRDRRWLTWQTVMRAVKEALKTTNGLEV
jgi:hypothetical protein